MDRKLLDYYPVFLQEVKEIYDLCQAEQPEIEAMDEAILKALDECFISSATEYGISRLEKVAGIKPPGADTLEERRFRLEMLMGGSDVCTLHNMKEFLERLLGKDGYSVQLYHEEYKLVIRVALSSKKRFQDALAYIKEVVPANLIIDMDLIYNRYQDLETFTHAQLHGKTHAQIRNEVL